MILSMTGYGRAEIKNNGYEFVSEIRSLNNRFLDISVRLPGSYIQFEQEVKNIVKEFLCRGRVNINISIKDTNNSKAGNFMVDKALAQNYIFILKELKENFSLDGEIQLSHLLSFPNIITFEEEASPQEEIWELVKKALRESLQDLVNMRKKEGDELAKDLRLRIGILDTCIDQIQVLAKDRVANEFVKLNERLAQLTATSNLDEGRIEQEIALLADRIDVTEECIRFRSHNKMFVGTFDDEQSGGRRLNFITQEMNREANTIGAKANDAEIARLVIQIKEELEKIREQVQNIE